MKETFARALEVLCDGAPSQTRRLTAFMGQEPRRRDHCAVIAWQGARGEVLDMTALSLGDGSMEEAPDEETAAMMALWNTAMTVGNHLSDNLYVSLGIASQPRVVTVVAIIPFNGVLEV